MASIKRSLGRRVVNQARKKEAREPLFFETSGGVFLELRKVPLMLIMEFMSESDKPQPPQKLIPMAISKSATEPDFEDAGYKAQLAEWETTHLIQMLRLCATYGVKDDPPNDEIARGLRWLYGNAMGEEELKYRWVATLLQDEVEMSDFIEAVVGLVTVTEEGLAEADARFPDDGQRETSQSVATQEPAQSGDQQGTIGDLSGRSTLRGDVPAGVPVPTGDAPHSASAGAALITV